MEIFRLYYLDAIADRKITDSELQTLRSLVEGLGIHQNTVKKEMLTIDDILKMQSLSLPLTPLEKVSITQAHTPPTLYRS